MIHIRKGAFARRVTVIHGPALDLLIQRRIISPAVWLPERSMVAWTSVRNVFTLSFDGLVKTLPLGITSDVLSQEIEAILNMRDLGFLVGELQTAFLQDVSHERLDLVTKKFL